MLRRISQAVKTPFADIGCPPHDPGSLPDPDVVHGFIGFILAFGYYAFEVGEQVLVVFISGDQAFG